MPAYDHVRRLAALLLFLTAIPASAAHSDIILLHTNGVLQVDKAVHDGDVRENDALDNGTVWATDNPGFFGSAFHFQDEFLFDLTGPLKRWDGASWSTNNLGAEAMDFIEPGPFGDPLNSATVTRATGFAAGYSIAKANTRGGIHTHFIFILRATNSAAPAVGAYSFPLTLRSPQYQGRPTVQLVFNNGLSEPDFAVALDAFQAAYESRLTLRRQPNGMLSLALYTQEGLNYQIESAPTPAGPWSNEGALFTGDGGRRETSVSLDSTKKFFRITRS